MKNKNDKSQVALTWFLYCILDLITFFAIKKSGTQNGGTQILFASAVCSFIMFIILYRKKMTWTWLETLISILIIVCISVWIKKGIHQAVLWGIISESVVGFYLMIKTFNFPVVQYNLPGYLLFLLACIIALYMASDWSLEEVGYPISEIILTSLTIIPLIKKWKKEKKYRSY